MGGNKDAPIYGAAEFASVPIFGFCNRGEYPRAEVQARLYRGSQLIVKSPFVTCTGTYNTSLPTAGVSRHEDYTLEIEIVGVTKEGRRFTNLPLSRSRTFYPAEE
ncbi:MAG: hypothetical protein K2Q26_07195 [Bdellovibrionales bacterium]|nr:hypothetical protein [Bdellovibrionales bacterium]